VNNISPILYRAGCAIIDKFFREHEAGQEPIENVEQPNKFPTSTAVSTNDGKFLQPNTQPHAHKTLGPP
jgi:hypothetical protein